MPRKSNWEREADQAVQKLKDAQKAIRRVCLWDAANSIDGSLRLAKYEIDRELLMYAFHKQSKGKKK